MEKAGITIEVKTYVHCPHCNKKESAIDHLKEEGKEHTFGTWYCHGCGGGYKGKVDSKGNVFVEKNNERKDDLLVFLQKDNIILIVKGMSTNGKVDEEHLRYYYEEHTCPENYFRSTELVVELESGSTDPHGLFEYKGCMPYRDLLNVDQEEVKKIIQENTN